MKNRIGIFLLLTFCFSSVILRAETKPEKIYERVYRYFMKSFPPKFSCKIEGKALEKSIQSIPKDAFLKGKKPYILLLFHKKFGSRVLLKDVVEAFSDRFSYIERVFEFIQPFSDQLSYKDFQKKYELFKVEANHFQIKKRYTKGSYLKVFLSKKGQIYKVQEYKNSKLFLTLQIRYKKISKYLIPYKLKAFFYEKKKLRILNFDLKNFDFNPKINEDDFLG